MPSSLDMTNSKMSEVAHKLSLNTDDKAQVVKFSPYIWSSNLLAVLTQSKLLIFTCNFNKDHQLTKHDRSDDGSYEADEEKFKCLADIRLTSSAVDVAWSPHATIAEFPQQLKLFVADVDHAVHYLQSYVKHQSKVTSAALTCVGKHSDYVNALAVHQDGVHVASVSDDLTCCVWAVQNQEQEHGETSKAMNIPLTSPGMSVCWHPSQASKLMVGEKKGVIRIYNFETQQAVMSLDAMRSPLLSADWCPTNQILFTAVVQGDWLIFDSSQSQLEVKRQGAHSGGARTVVWSPFHEHLIVTSGRPGVEIKVFNIHSAQAIFSVDLKVSSGLSWHCQQPMICAGVDNEVHFWTIDTHL